MSVEFRFAKADEYLPIAHFINDHWAKDHIYVRSEPLFRWTFARDGCWDQDGFSVAVAISGDELVGVLGGIPFDFNLYGKTLRGVWLANYVIREDHRRGPTALKLLSMLRGEPFRATVAFGVNPATANIYQVLRGRVLPFIPRHIAVVPEAAARVIGLLKSVHPDWTGSQAAELVEKFVLEAPSGAADAVGDTLPGNWDEVCWQTIARTTVGAARDRKYLEWRYRRHPLFEYRFITIPQGERTGLLVWRCETIHRATGAGRVPVDRIARVLEFLPASEENAHSLGAALLKQMRTAETFGADYYGFHGPTAAILNRLGFRRAGEGDAELFPTRFQPLDGKGGNILSAAFLPAEAPPCTGASECPWYWTKSDSDQDRPN